MDPLQLDPLPGKELSFEDCVQLAEAQGAKDDASDTRASVSWVATWV